MYESKKLKINFYNYFIIQAQHSVGILLAVTAWSITEIIRYAYYALNLFQVSPQWLTWCRLVELNFFLSLKFF